MLHDGRAFSSGVRWVHRAGRDEIWLMTPAGQALAHLLGDAGGATLTGSDGKQYRAGDIASLLRRAFGWEMPVARLAWWVQGEIAPGSVIQQVERDERGRLAVLAQDDWRIAYAYEPAEDQATRLRRLTLTGEAREIRLVVDGWRQDFAGADPAESSSRQPVDLK